MADRRYSVWAGRGAGILLLLSLAFPYWQAEVFAPQYPGGLRAKMYAYRVGGDAQEIDSLNHYIGLGRLDSFGRLERIASVPAAVTLAFFCWILAGLKRREFQWLIFLTILAYPIVFIADMAFWMRYASTHLDPTAPLKIKSFTIPIWGSGTIAQFRSNVGPQAGFYLVLAAVGFTAIALFLSRPSKKEDTGLLSSVKGAALVFLITAIVAGGLFAQPLPLQDQISAAAPGAVIDLAPGIYQAPIVIDKTLTLRGDGHVIISAEGKGTVITVRAPGVTLASLEIQHSGESLLFEDSGVRVEAPNVRIQHCRIENVLFGVFLAKAPDAWLEDNIIRGKALDLGQRGDLIRLWYSDRPVMRRNQLIDGRDTVLWYSHGSIFEDNVVQGGRYGLHFMYTNQARVAGNRFVANSVGAYVMYSKDVMFEANHFENNRGPSGAGLGLKESNRVTVLKNVFLNNRQGLFIDQSPTIPEETNRFQDNILAFNDIGVAILPGVQGDLFTGNIFDDNLEQVSVRGGGQLHGNVWAENGRGNFWSDYAGYGLKGALIGRVAYHADNSFESLMDQAPFTRLFAFSPASQAIELAGRAFPLFKPKPKLIDPSPLLEPGGSLPRLSVVQASVSPLVPTALMLMPLGFMGWLTRRRGLGAGTLSRPQAESPRRAPSSAITVRSLSKSFKGRPVITNLSMELPANQTLVLWGSNGAGKSTLLKALLGLLPVTGEIRLLGHDIVREGHIARQRVGYLPQEFTWYDWTVRDAMEFICRLRGLSPDRMTPVLNQCRLEGEETKMVQALSGGMKQKLALAQALVAEPDLLLLDEPCSNLDLRSRHEMLDILRQLKGSRTIILTSHHLEEVEALADQVLWMEAGKPARGMDMDAFYHELGSSLPLWVRLDHASANPQAMDLLRQKGYQVSPDGDGIFVYIEPRRKMEIVRCLESAGLAVRDVRQEAGS